MKVLPQTFLVGLLCIGYWNFASASVGQVSNIEGQAFIEREGVRYRAIDSAKLRQGDKVVTGKFSAVNWEFSDRSTYEMTSSSELTITAYDFQDQTSSNGFRKLLIDLLRGGFRSLTGLIGSSTSDEYSVRTPSAAMSVLGTDYQITFVDSDMAPQLGLAAGTYVFVFKGNVKLTNTKGSLTIQAGQLGFAPDTIDHAPVLMSINDALLRKLTDIDTLVDFEFAPFVLGDEPKPRPSIPPGQPIPQPSPTATVAPTATVTPRPSPTPLATPTPSATPTPTPSSTPSPTAPPTPQPTMPPPPPTPTPVSPA